MKKKVFLSFAALTAAFTMNAQSKLPVFKENLDLGQSVKADLVKPAKQRTASASDISYYYWENNSRVTKEINDHLAINPVQTASGPLKFDTLGLFGYRVANKLNGSTPYWQKLVQGIPTTAPINLTKVRFLGRSTKAVNDTMPSSNVVVKVYDKDMVNVLASKTLNISTTWGWKDVVFDAPVSTSDTVLVTFEMATAADIFQLAHSHNYFKGGNLKTMFTGVADAAYPTFNSALPFVGDAAILATNPNQGSTLGLIKQNFDFFIIPSFTYDFTTQFTADKTNICSGESVTISTPANALALNPVLNYIRWNELANGATPLNSVYSVNGGTEATSSTFSKTIPFTTNGVFTVKAKGVMAPWIASSLLEDSTMITINVGPQLSGANAVCAGSTATFSTSVAGGTWLVASGTAYASVLNGVVTGKAAGSATIRYTKTGTCAGVVNKVITVNAKPSAGTLGGTLTSTAKFAVCPTTTRANTTTVAGGTWASANNAIATVDNSGLVTGVAAGTTTVSYTVTDANGCSNKVSRSVIVDSKPTTPVIYGTNIMMCQSGKGYITASLPNGTWSTIDTYLKFSTLNNGMFFQQNTIPTDNFVSGVKYTMFSTNRGCTSEATKEIKLRKLAQKAVTITATSTNLVVNQQVTATAATTMTAAGAWRSFLPASLSATVSPTNNKQATIKGLAVGTNAYVMFQAKDAATGCNNGGWLAFNVTATQSIVDANPTTVSTTTGVSVYPNPSKGVVTFENIAGANAISLVDMTGRTIKTVAVNADRMTVDFSGVQNGKYLVQVAGENVNEVRSIVIE